MRVKLKHDGTPGGFSLTGTDGEPVKLNISAAVITLKPLEHNYGHLDVFIDETEIVFDAEVIRWLNPGDGRTYILTPDE